MVAITTLVLSACGSSSKSSSSSTASPSTTSGSSASSSPTGAAAASQPSGTPLKVGYIAQSNSAQASATTGVQPSAQAWADYENAHGGINGHPVQLDVQLEPSNPGVALADVQKLVSDGVIAIIDSDGGDDASWTSYIVSKNIPVYATGFNSPAMTVSPDNFSPATSEFYFDFELVESALKLNEKKMGFMYCAEQPVCAQEVAPLKTTAKALGVDVVFTTSVLASAPNYTAQCLAAKQAGVNAMYLADAPAPVLAIAADCIQQGYTPAQISDDGAFSQSFAKAPGFDGMIATEDNIPFFVSSTPASATMHGAWQQYEPQILKSPNLDEEAVIAWSAGMLIAEGAQAGGVGAASPLSGSALTSGMYTLHQTNVGGLTPTLTFVRNQPHESQCWFWVRVQNGAFSTPYGLTPSCAPAPANIVPPGA
jgi:branched-chain amino acid transport system substrate-binding protein